jgi:S1-C subfamily serine protease
VRRVLHLALFCLAVATLTFGQSQTASTTVPLSASAAIEQMRPSIVQVMATASEGRSGGSGFVVANNYVITNCHVVGLCRHNPILTNPSVRVGFRIPNFTTAGIEMKERTT